MAPSVTFRPYERDATPAWMGTPITHPKTTIPGGILIEASEFPTVTERDNKRFLEGGTFLGRTIAERDAGTGFGPALETDEEFAIALVDVADLDEDNITAGLQPNVGTVIYENFCPGFAAATAAVQAEFRKYYLLMTAHA